MPRTSAAPVVGVDSLAHQKGCPEGRMESYPAVRPDGSEVTVVRCGDCGAHHVFNEVLKETNDG